MDFADAPYRQRLALMVKLACRKYGLRERSSDALLTRDVGEGDEFAAQGPDGGAGPGRRSAGAAVCVDETVWVAC